MNSTEPNLQPPDYGIDAPGVVRNLFIGAAIGWVACLTVWFGLWSGKFSVPLPGVSLDFSLGGTGLWFGVACTFMGAWMVWDSKVGKIKGRERLMDRIKWTGNERVLDVGCGRGLMLIGAAKRLTTGRATGIDIWQAEDLSGNKPESTAENARREGVLDLVEIKAGDMRQIPFPDATFDVIVSRAAIHNIYDSAGRAKAIAEIARVMKPGAYALIEDIRHHRQYIKVFKQNGCPDIQNVAPFAVYLLLTIITFGKLSPATLIVRKTP